MIGFVAVNGVDLTATPLGCLQFIPVASKQDIEQHGLPTRKNLARHLFLQSEMDAARLA